MVHNGIEYGLMQAYAEGFDILKNANIEALPAEHRFDLDIADIAEVWRRGSVIPSWLLDLTATALAQRRTRSTAYSGFVEDSGEGRWTVNAAIDEAVPAEVLTAALFARFRSRKEHTFAEKILSAMRDGFGGHKEPSSIRTRPAKRARNRQAEGRPLVTDALRQRTNQTKPDPCSFVIFGVTGDLTHRLVMPALYNLGRPDLLPEKFCVVGVARKGMSNDASARQPDEGPAPIRHPPGRRRDRQAACSNASPASRPIRRTRPRSTRMREQLEQAGSDARTGGNRLFYLATPPDRVRADRARARPHRPAAREQRRRGAGWWSKSRSAPISPRPRR